MDYKTDIKIPKPPRSGKAETFLERVIFQSRWALMPFYIGLIFALVLYAFHFILQVVDLMYMVHTIESEEILVFMLTLVDKVLISSLIIMVIIGGYENSVSRLNISDHERKVSWLGKLDSTSLKIKLATSIVSISSVHLLKVFLNLEQHITIYELNGKLIKDITTIYVTVGVHLVMVVSALMLAFLDYLGNRKLTGRKLDLIS